MHVRVAGEVDLSGSLVDLMAGVSVGVIQDELVSHVTQNLVCHSFTHAHKKRDECKNKDTNSYIQS